MQPNQEHIKNQNIDYYDKISTHYDTILSHETKNDFVRKKVEDKLTSLIKSGLVLDFGGGTGEDLKWLTANGYSVIFCEPSPGMRKIAIGKFPNSGVKFIENNQADFTTWNKIVPFPEKVNAVIANFAVLNCILDIDLFFKDLALVTKSKAEIILLVLNFDLKKRIRLDVFETIKSLMSMKPMHVKIDFEGNQQLVYLHSVKSIQKVSADNFEFKECEQLKEHGFSLIHLTRK
jgi:ubiquinone/menaquinone biosynthesis C-methylase UbiE